LLFGHRRIAAQESRLQALFRTSSVVGWSSTSEDSAKAAVPRQYAFTPDNAYLIAVDFGKDCQERVKTFLRIKQQIETRYAGAENGIRLDIESGSVAIPTGSNRTLVLCSSTESLRIPDWIKAIRADDFCFCPNLRTVIVGLQREINGFRNCRKLGQVELSRSVEVIGREAFSIAEDKSSRSAEAGRVRRRLFLTVGDEWWLTRSDEAATFSSPGKFQKRKRTTRLLFPRSFRT
jgi:hypothetical protein